MGCDVILAENGRLALEEVEAHPEIAAIITDLQMPEMNGFELIKKVKKNRPNIPILVITGFIDEINVRRAKEIGAAGVIGKPINWQELQTWLQNLRR